MNSDWPVKKDENVVARKIHDKYFLVNITDNYSHDKCVIYEVNEIGYFIWNKINGKKTREDLARLLQLEINDNVDYHLIYHDVVEFLDKLKNKGFITINNLR